MLKLIRPGLDVSWIGALERFVITHKHENTGAFRIVHLVQNANGSFRIPDNRDIVACQNVDWELLDKYPDHNALADYLIEQRRAKHLKKIKDRRNWIRDYLRDNKKGVKEAVRNMLERGHTGPSRAEMRERKKRIQIEVPNNYQPTQAGLYVPFAFTPKGQS